MDLHVRDYEDAAYKVRPLTFEEARKYNDLIKNKDLDDWFWTCTPWSTEENSKYGVAVVSPGGNINNNNCNNNNGVRPFCIKQADRVGKKPKSEKGTKRLASFPKWVNTKVFYICTKMLFAILKICIKHINGQNTARSLMGVVQDFKRCH